MNRISYSPVAIHFAWLWWSPTASKGLSYGLNLRMFLGEHDPRPPFMVLEHCALYACKQMRVLCTRTWLHQLSLYVCPPFFNLWIHPCIVESRALCRTSSMCQLLLNKLHNGHLAALFPEVTHAEFFRRELECILGFNQEEIYDFTMGKVYSLLLKELSGSLNAWWAWHICQFQHFGKRYRLFPRIKSLAKWGNAIVQKQFCSGKFLISHLLYWYTPREGLCTAKLHIGVPIHSTKCVWPRP